MSFILAFTRLDGAAGAPVEGVPGWRGSIEEVESGEKRTIMSVASLVRAVADQGVSLPPDLSEPGVCPVCGRALGPGREAL